MLLTSPSFATGALRNIFVRHDWTENPIDMITALHRCTVASNLKGRLRSPEKHPMVAADIGRLWGALGHFMITTMPKDAIRQYVWAPDLHLVNCCMYGCVCVWMCVCGCVVVWCVF